MSCVALSQSKLGITKMATAGATMLSFSLVHQKAMDDITETTSVFFQSVVKSPVF